jgi:outer membrane murein-binding lipoprotein Lpp
VVITMPMTLRVSTALVGSMLLLAGTSTAEQTPTSVSPESALLQQLLTEVRQLRSSLEHAANESAGLQLLAVRAAMQEERLYRVSRDVESLRSELEVAKRDVRTLTVTVKDFSQSVDEETDPLRRKGLEAELPAMRTKLQAAREREQLLVQQEATMSGNLATEEGRWQDINARLDDLERRLASRSPRP